jgi:hypothetical protein
VTGSDATVRSSLESIRVRLFGAIVDDGGGLPQHTAGKLAEVATSLKSETPAKIDDEVVARHMSYVKLIEELRAREVD